MKTGLAETKYKIVHVEHSGLGKTFITAGIVYHTIKTEYKTHI